MVEISFSSKREEVVEFFERQNVLFKSPLMDSVLKFLSKACSYEEEERKIFPQLLIGTNIETVQFKRLFQLELLHMITDSFETPNFEKRIKQLLPFCNNGWRVYIDISATEIKYGLIRSFSGPAGLSVKEALSNDSHEVAEEIQKNYNISHILIDVYGSFEVLLLGANGDQAKIDFRIHNNSDLDLDKIKGEFLDDFLSETIHLDEKVNRSIKRAIDLFGQKLHGGICLIINKDHTLPDDNLKDGIFLETPIDLVSLSSSALGLENGLTDIDYNNAAQERFYAMTGLFIEMLNIDGITIVDSSGRIRAYNVFIKPDPSKDVAVSGGARKRAAMSLVTSKNENYVGVYSQSQDGSPLYERVIKQ